MAEVNKAQFLRPFRPCDFKWFREMKSELKKVVWPSGKQLVNNTLVVLASILIVGIIVCLFDWLANEGVTLLGKF